MMAAAAQWVVIIFGVWLMAVSVLMFASPQTALRYLGKFASTNLINYLEITLRLIVGMALVTYAEHSRFPEIFRITGLFVAVTSVMLFFVPRKWHAGYAVWWANKLTAPFVKMVSPLSFAAGIFLIYAVV